MTVEMNSIAEGIVYLVGAGPGDPELITVKGKQLMQTCDAVIFDNLIPDELIVSLPHRIEKHYVGKKAGQHALPQNEINQLMVDLALDGKKVVRLKGGDPFTFGRGGEEAKFLKDNGIRFEIVPGITAGIAVPAYTGIPCTERSKASYVTFVTGHKAKDKAVSSVPWDWIAKAKNGTLVIYMGVSEFGNIARTLIENGLSPETSAAVIERGTLPSQRIVASPLHRLPEKILEANIKPPAIFIIGDVVEFHKELNWFHNKPFFGLRVMVTRPSDQAQDMYRSLRELGAEVLPYPTIATDEYIDSQAWDAFKDINKQPAANDNWLVFTSENGVRYFIGQLVKRSYDIRCLGAFKIAAVGFGTARALEKYKLKADFIPQKATTASLALQMQNNIKLDSATVVRIRGSLGDDTVEQTLTEANAKVIRMQTYRTFHPVWPDGFKDKLFDYPPEVIIFTSGSTVEGFCNILNKGDVEKLTTNAIVVSIGPSTSKIIKSHGIHVSLEAKEHNIPGIIKELLRYFKDKKSVK